MPRALIGRDPEVLKGCRRTSLLERQHPRQVEEAHYRSSIDAPMREYRVIVSMGERIESTDKCDIESDVVADNHHFLALVTFPALLFSTVVLRVARRRRFEAASAAS